ncbi:MAG TPA: hypothetical protein PKB08_12265, partial [Burkholderiaceae bacterium]|nr:hypothetical protein [Burkholderiaceae bacterium]
MKAARWALEGRIAWERAARGADGARAARGRRLDQPASAFSTARRAITVTIAARYSAEACRS